MVHYEPPHLDLQFANSHIFGDLALLHSERPKLHAILAFLSAMGLKIKHSLSDGDIFVLDLLHARCHMSQIYVYL